MPVNRNALIRYKTLDSCLRNRYRKWTLEDLVEACCQVLYEYEGIGKGVSQRTIQADLQIMRSEKLGYNAPIIVVDKKHYTYADPHYSITNIPLTEQDLITLSRVVDVLKQFQGFSYYEELSGMVHKLDDKLRTRKLGQESVIDLEKNEQVDGLMYLESIYQAILQKQVLWVEYQSFNAKGVQAFDFHGYLLKQYRNRWFVIGIQQENGPLLTLALDRIKSVAVSQADYVPNVKLDLKAYFTQVIGVTVCVGIRPQDVKLFVDATQAPYILTKPLHSSQKVLDRTPEGIVICLRVQLNYELEREILGFGECMQVLSPRKLQVRMRERLQKMLNHYSPVPDRATHP